MFCEALNYLMSPEGSEHISASYVSILFGKAKINSEVEYMRRM